jgi:hypothetical protein
VKTPTTYFVARGVLGFLYLMLLVLAVLGLRHTGPLSGLGGVTDSVDTWFSLLTRAFWR